LNALEQLLEQKLKTDSFYARGVYLDKMKASDMEERGDCAGKAVALIECLAEAGALTQTAAAVALRRNRQEMGAAAKGLWLAGVVDIYSVFSQNAPGTANAQFQLWVAKGCRHPADAGDACRQAVLGLFYAHARLEMPGFGWRLVRRPGRPVLAEVSFASKDGEAIRWLVDAPRLGDDPAPEADIFIYPDCEDAEQKTPAGKKYTWDLAIVGARPDEFSRAVKLKK
jgi:hypothetical protein